MSAIVDLNEISPKIMRDIKLLVRNGKTPHDIGHIVAHHYTDMGVAFYRLVERAAEEALAAIAEVQV